MNSVVLMGNLGQAPELKYTGGGMAVMELRLATNERRKQGDEWVNEAEWHTVVAFGKRAEGLNKVGLDKGDKVCVRGRLKTDSYEKDGVRRYRTKVLAEDIELCGGGKGGGRRSGGSSDYSGYGGASGGDDFGDGPDDLPF